MEHLLRALAALADSFDRSGLPAKADALDNILRIAGEEPNWDKIDLTRLFNRYFFPDGFRILEYDPDTIKLVGKSGLTALALHPSLKGISVLATWPTHAKLYRRPPNGTLHMEKTSEGSQWVIKGYITSRSRPGALAKLRAFIFLFGKTEADALHDAPKTSRKQPPKQSPKQYPKTHSKIDPGSEGAPQNPRIPESVQPKPKEKPKHKETPKEKTERLRVLLRRMEENPPAESLNPSPREKKEKRQHEEWMTNLREWLSAYPEPQ